MEKKGDGGENEDRSSVLRGKVLTPDTSFCTQPHLRQNRPPPALLVDCEFFLNHAWEIFRKVLHDCQCEWRVSVINLNRLPGTCAAHRLLELFMRHSFYEKMQPNNILTHFLPTHCTSPFKAIWASISPGKTAEERSKSLHRNTEVFFYAPPSTLSTHILSSFSRAPPYGWLYSVIPVNNK